MNLKIFIWLTAGVLLQAIASPLIAQEETPAKLSTFKGQICEPCHSSRGTTQLSKRELTSFLKLVPLWDYHQYDSKISRRINFENSTKMFLFIDKLTEVAEKHGHHPNIYIEFKRLTIELYTHSVTGLTKNDFVLATDIDYTWKNYEVYLNSLPDVPDPETNCCYLSPSIPGFGMKSFKDIINGCPIPNGWNLEHFNTYKWFILTNFVMAADKLKKVVGYLINNHFPTYQVSLLFYNNLRVEIKKQICQNKNAYEKVIAFTKDIDDMVLN